MRLMIAVKLIEKGNILIEVCIQIVTGESHVRLNVVGEMNNLDLNILLRQCGLDRTKDFFRRSWSYTDAQDFAVVGSASRNSEEKRSEPCYARTFVDRPDR